MPSDERDSGISRLGVGVVQLVDYLVQRVIGALPLRHSHDGLASCTTHEQKLSPRTYRCLYLGLKAGMLTVLFIKALRGDVSLRPSGTLSGGQFPTGVDRYAPSPYAPFYLLLLGNASFLSPRYCTKYASKQLMARPPSATGCFFVVCPYSPRYRIPMREYVSEFPRSPFVGNRVNRGTVPFS